MLLPVQPFLLQAVEFGITANLQCLARLSLAQRAGPGVIAGLVDEGLSDGCHGCCVLGRLKVIEADRCQVAAVRDSEKIVKAIGNITTFKHATEAASHGYIWCGVDRQLNCPAMPSCRAQGGFAEVCNSSSVISYYWPFES